MGSVVITGLRRLGVVSLAGLLAACVASSERADCSNALGSGGGCPPAGAIDDAQIAGLSSHRAALSTGELEIDSITLGIEADIPAQTADARIIGPRHQDSIRSLAAKIWLIDNAQHTIDAVYYIFARDLVGYSILGALCDAVKRGVDVRLIVDSIGSTQSNHPELKALKNCSAQAGFMRNSKGQVTTTRAKAQVAVFNAISRASASKNRRSHDKMLVVDADFPERAVVLTGGRNISLDYYGLKENGDIDPTAFKDMEILLRDPSSGAGDGPGVGPVAGRYFDLLYANDGNKFLDTGFAYESEADKSRDALQRLRTLDEFALQYGNMAEFTTLGLRPAKVRLAHEMGNLNSKDIVASFDKNLARNPNSIVGLLQQIAQQGSDLKFLRLVSPYLFLARYVDKDGVVIYDELDKLRDWLAEDPQRSIEIITNSVMSSDNAMAQSIIDFDMAPRLLLAPDMLEQWRAVPARGEQNPQLVQSAAWIKAIDNPGLRIYQIGKLDSVLLGGDAYYGKLHAKFLFADSIGFVGTSNLDYRSRLLNNEMGYFFHGEQLQQDLQAEFDRLKELSLLWGSPEWLDMRARMREGFGIKSTATENQRELYYELEATGLKWQI